VFAAPGPDFTEPADTEAIFAKPSQPSDTDAPNADVSCEHREAPQPMRQMARSPEAARVDPAATRPRGTEQPKAATASDGANTLAASEPLSQSHRLAEAVPPLLPQVLPPSDPQAPTAGRGYHALQQRSGPASEPAVATPGETLFPPLHAESAVPIAAHVVFAAGDRFAAPRPVEVTIGTIEIRSEAPRGAPRPAPQRERAAGGAQLMSLADYLAKGRG
jgi:hypothetical protein